MNHSHVRAQTQSGQPDRLLEELYTHSDHRKSVCVRVCSLWKAFLWEARWAPRGETALVSPRVAVESEHWRNHVLFLSAQHANSSQRRVSIATYEANAAFSA